MSKRIESSKTGYLFSGYVADAECRIMWSEYDFLNPPNALTELYRRKSDCVDDGKRLVGAWTNWSDEDYRPRKVRVTLIVEDITDGDPA
jgi:hypothetical protein